MILAQTVVKMMGRRLALRKGLAVSAAVLLLLGWGLLYLSLSKGSSSADVDSSPVTHREMSPTTSPLKPKYSILPVHKAPLNLSVFPAHLRSPPPIPLNPAQPGQWSNHTIIHYQQCRLTEITEISDVDVQVRLFP